MVRDSIFSISFASSALFTQCTAILCDMVSDKCFFRPVVKMRNSQRCMVDRLQSEQLRTFVSGIFLQEANQLLDRVPPKLKSNSSPELFPFLLAPMYRYRHP
jgi:hypothetical protein